MADIKKALASKVPSASLIIPNQDAILYALSINFGKDPLQDLKYTYENHEDFQVFNAYINIMNFKVRQLDITLVEGLPEFNPMNLLHGEQINEYFRPLQVDKEYFVNTKVIDISDKGKGVVIVTESNWSEKDQAGKDLPVAKVTSSIFIKKISAGGYKGEGKVPAIPKAPTSKPTFVFEEQTDPNQASLYRLNGDFNPLHMDPEMAKMGGFDKPILHGLCFYSLAAKVLVKNVLKEDQSAIKKYHARFVGSVFPGEKITFSYWQNGNQIYVSGRVAERNQECIQGYFILDEKAKL